MIPHDSKASQPAQLSAGTMRAYVRSLAGATAGAEIPLETGQMHHLVHVRRLASGALLEVFDEQRLAAPARLQVEGDHAKLLLLADPSQRPPGRLLVVYSALPKGSRADWMVEKLAELGVAQFVPLKTQRSVVDPGPGKLDRLARIAREAARQSRSPGPMQINPPASLADALRDVVTGAQPAAVLTTERPGAPLATLKPQALFIGPEGGWTTTELEGMLSAGLAPATLTGTTLRVETAAICAAAIVLAGAND